ncbi:aminodeoxychorismate synthase component I [Desulfopila aestuarii]|uniref:aminodeoxychorismate synthase n=1 Tax=Desulfopila aestuarii DSM 18488 TaxID=1121416 RepID=A0A1M7XYP0_9BACT|nr:aminodeoxychorismate synthase component I [Desulfopila aestuarii]SHO43959.1 aminodeoxychorismate synthase, component I [Desulfopila aestuarii DSM 18488]
MKNDAQENLSVHLGRLSGVHIENIDLDIDFIELAARFSHIPGTVVLLSGGDLDCARYHIMGALPWLTLSADTQQANVIIDQETFTLDSNPFELLRWLITQLTLPTGDWPPPLAAGFLGYLSYDLKNCLEQLPNTGVDDLKLPEMLLYAHSLLVVHDKETNTTQLLIPHRDGVSPAACRDVDFLKAQFYAMSAKSSAKSLSTADGFNELTSNFSQTGYEEAIQQILEYISAGDVYQVNLSQRFQVPFSGDTFALFSHLYQKNPAPFFAYVQAGDHQIVSTSPERFLLRSGSRIEARPIKGTMPRGKTASEDQDMRQALISSTKDDAELSMIVDLLRNDIGKVCAPFSVHVAEHKRMEAYQNVFHQVSIVEGKLDSDKDTVDLITATFPGGSITGCPKIRAMEIIDELESHRRHVYCGSIGYLSFHDTMDLSIAIRTATVVNNTLSFSVGGGIVFDSIPKSEYEETLHKGKTLIEACLRGA